MAIYFTAMFKFFPNLPYIIFSMLIEFSEKLVLLFSLLEGVGFLQKI